MTPRAYYNEWDKFAAAWLRELIKAGLIMAGDVDERSIKDVRPNDLRGYTRVHFFAGIGGWDYALQLAGWPADREVWTGSAPCQPWSIANVWEGGGQGATDERHLWPDLYRNIRERKPTIVFGEQVVGAISKGWLDECFGNLESSNYACASAVLRAKDCNADHERKRLYWLAHACGKGWEGYKSITGLSVAAAAALPEYGNPLIGARRALDGDYSDLLPCDGLSVIMERNAIKGYGNAIVPEVAAEFIRAYCGTERIQMVDKLCEGT